MKFPILFLLLFALIIGQTVQAQIKIGDNPQNIDANSVLELESSTKVLVITRVTSAEMNAIVPSQGALVYNTDTQCVYYFDSTQWVNLCESIGLTFTTDSTVDPDLPETILITQDGNNYNFEVAPLSIRNEQIANGGINGVKIQENSIGADRLAPNSVGVEELQTNTVADEEINYDLVTLNDFTNDAGYITGAQIISANTPNAIIPGTDGGAFYDDSALQTNVASNTTNITTNTQNITQNSTNIGSNTAAIIQNTSDIATKEDAANKSNAALGTSTVLFPTQNAVKTYVDAAVGGSAQTIVSGNTPNSITEGTDGGALFNAIPLQNNIATNTTNLATHIANDDTDDTNELVDLAFDTGTNILSISKSATILGATVDLSSLAGGGGGSTEIADQTTISGVGTPGDPFKIQPLAPAPAANQMLITNTAGDIAWIPAATGGGSTELADQATIVGDGQLGTEFAVANGGITNVQIANETIVSEDIFDGTIVSGDIANNTITNTNLAPGSADQILRTDATGTQVNWVDFPVTTGSTEVADLTTITGTGAVGDPFKIEPGANGQFLSTSAGQVIWDNLPAGTGGTVDADNLTIEGNGVNPNPLQVRNGGITNVQIANESILSEDILDGTIVTGDISNNSITLPKLANGTTAGELMQWNGTTWVLINQSALTITEADGIIGNEVSAIADATLLLTGAGTAADPFTLDVSPNGIGTNELADNSVTSVKILDLTIAAADIADNAVTNAKINANAVTTIKIADNNITPAKIAEGSDGQILTTNGTDVIWAAPTPGDVISDASLVGNGNTVPLSLASNAVTAVNIVDKNVIPEKIAPGNPGQVLTTNGADVVWAAPTAGVVGTGTTIIGDGTVGNELDIAPNAITSAMIIDGAVQNGDIANDGVTTLKILNANVTPAKLQPSATNGQVLTTVGGNVQWAAAAAGAVGTGTTIIGDGTVGNELDIAPNAITTAMIIDGAVQTGDIANDGVTTLKILNANVTPAKLQPSATNGQVLTTVGGNVQWAAAAAGAVGTGTTITGDGTVGNELDIAPNAITSAMIIDGAVQNGDIATNAVTTIKIQDANVTTGKIAPGTNGQVLSTVGGVAQWAAATAGAVGTGTTITGDGTAGNELDIASDAITSAMIIDGAVQTGDIANDGVTTPKILNANVTPAKLQPSATNGQVLTTVGGNVQWAAVAGSQNLFDADQNLSNDRTHNLGGNDFVFGGSGQVGVGDFGSPGSPASVRSKFDVDGQVTASNGFAASSGTEGNPAYGFFTGGDTNMGMFRAGVDQLAFSTNGAEALRIDNAQNVGIGVPAPGIPNILSELHVNGDIRAEGDFISSNTTIQLPDYVFEKYFDGYSALNENYQFKSLEEIEAFVKKNNHLPGIKSVVQVKKEGSWNLSESNLQNLEKIEELFLHTIEQEKKINTLQKENENINQELLNLKKELEAIKNLIKEK